jgi:FixJ family two-component response regulator
MQKLIHDVRNKLTILAGQSFRLSKKLGADELVVVDQTIEQIEELINKFLSNRSSFETEEKVPPSQMKNSELNEFLGTRDIEPLIQMNGLIYLIDDEPQIMKDLSEMITPYGFKTKLFNDATDAIANIKSDRPDLILSDISMPGMTGIDLLKFCNTNKIDVPIIFISGLISKDVMLKCINNGAYAFIEKPFKEEQVISNCSNAIKKYKMQQNFTKSINSVLYQFADVDSKLELFGEDDIRLSLKTEIDKIMELKKLLKS